MFRSTLLALALLALTACDAAQEAAQGAKNLAGDAAKAAGGIVDTRTACTLAGQEEAFCGCLQTELGPRIDPAHIDALGAVLRESLGGGGLTGAVERAGSLDPALRQALLTCGVQSAVSGG